MIGKYSKILMILGLVMLLGGISVTVIGGLYPRFGEFLPGGPTRIGAGVAVIGVLPLILGLAGALIGMLRHQVVKRPGIVVQRAIEQEYAALISSGKLRESTASWPAVKKLVGEIEDCPVIVQMTFRPGDEVYRYAQRTEFFSPFPGAGDMGFQLLPTGTKPEAIWDAEQAFGRMFYIDKKETEAFERSRFDRSARAAMVNFQARHDGGLLTVGPKGVTWSVNRLDLGGRGGELIREFAQTARTIHRTLSGKSPLDSNHSRVQEALQTESRNPPVYASRKQLIVIFCFLFIVGLLCLIGGLALDEELGKFKLILYLIAGATLIPSLVGTPLLVYHLISARSAARPNPPSGTGS